jgi:hypothetical protein
MVSMALQLRCHSAKGEQILDLQRGRPIRVRIRSSEHGESVLTILSEDGEHCQYRLEGSMPIQLDGQTTRSEGDLHSGVVLAVHRMQFMLIPEHHIDTKPIAAYPSSETSTTRPVAMACGTSSDDETVPAKEPSQRAVQNLPQANPKDEETVASPSNLAVTDESVPQGATNGRQVVRLSASKDAIATKENPSMLAKVGRLFQRKTEAATRLKELLVQRTQLFEFAGRKLLGQGCGLGLPDQALVKMLDNEKVTLHPDDLNRAQLQEFSERRKMLGYIEAEIRSLRQEIGISGEVDDPISDKILRSDQADRQNRAFQVSDVANTEDLQDLKPPSDHDEDANDDLSPNQSPGAPKRSVRRRRRW